MNTYLFIAACVLSIIVVIVYTFVSVAIHRRDLCRKSPYYFCDNDWLCCKPGLLCDVAAGGPSTQGTEANAYFLTDQIYGSNRTSNPSGNTIAPCRGESSAGSKTYYEACIEPVKLITNHYNNLNESIPADAMSCLYTTNCPDSTTFNSFKDISPDLANLTPGQCCYQPIDPTDFNTGGQSIGQYYPSKDSTGAISNGSWNSASTFAGQYQPNTQGYIFPPTKLDTTNNSCSNTLFGAPAGISRADAYRYTGCPGS